MSLVNCDCFCQNKHLFVQEATSPKIIPAVLPISGGLGEREEVGVVFCQDLALSGWLHHGEKSDIAVCATDCSQNCPALASVPIHHHLSTIRAVMICRLEMDGACRVLRVGAVLAGASFHLVVTHEHSEEQGRLMCC